MLEIFMIADITPKLRTVIHCMLLQILHCLPDDLSIFVSFIALVGEFTEVNAVLNDFVNFGQEIATGLANRAADLPAWS